MIVCWVVKMAPFPVTIFAFAVGLGLVLACSADAAQSRKQRRHLAAPTVVTVNPYYRGANLFPAGPIFYGNEYLGDDPDPFIRLQIWRDLGAHFGGGR
jgi:hypothetical protein